ncbi:hypothetical protein BC332_17945, partial [Capsicum chinense]
MAYTSVASLMRTMGVVLASKLPMRSVISDHEEEFLALHKKVSFFEIFLKNFEKNKTSGKMTDLEAQIKELATVVEQIIQQRLTEIVTADNVLQREKIHEWFQDSLKQVVEEFDCVQKELTKFQDKGKQAPKEFLVQDSSSVKHTPYAENNMVGRDDQMKWMLTELTRYGGSSGELKVIPIVGMGDVGKTTLAKEVYNDESIRLHFDVRAWATVSQKHNIKEILLSLWRCEKGENIYVDSEAELADMLQKSLKGKRYLIVLDDMWDSEAWDAMRLCFPSENNGSRILLTTRNTEVARCAGTKNLSLQMSFMDQHESWNLFESIAFSNEVLPSEFETIGKQIVNKCHGLPLSISVIVSLIWLTYLALSFVREFHIPRAIYRLWNLQTFIAEGSNFAIGYFHEEILGLTQLRHLELRTFYLPNLPDGSVNKGRLLDFPNIQTISYLSPRYCTKEVILGIQNAKKLGIRGDVDDFKSIQDSGLLNNLVHLQQLETLSLKLIFCPMSVRISLGTIPSAKAFPATLKKLKLDGTWLSWSCLDIIAELPNLEVLKLMNAACCGEEWHPNVRGFTRLKLLHIIQHDLKYWEATHDNFPVLERLMLSGFRYLKEIPIEFAEINILPQIVLRGCLPELGESAARIQKEQDDLGNKPVDVHFSDR